MKSPNLYIYGGGGHGQVVADIARSVGYQNISFLDDAHGRKFDEHLPKGDIIVAVGDLGLARVGLAVLVAVEVLGLGVDGWTLGWVTLGVTLADGVVKYHRTLGTTLNALIGAGLTISNVNEWGPAQAQIDAWPALAEEAERPMLVLIAARKAQ